MALNGLPVEQQRALRVEGMPECPTVPAVAAGTSVASLYREGRLGEQGELTTQAVFNTVGCIVDKDLLQRFHVVPGCADALGLATSRVLLDPPRD
ncbi:hypothetical protein ITJ66_16500 [Plantibacter sp. VKM Ac-2885]|uniref:hypothetical protein n=1 Tax=Plantibacter sp. VKM Ac-2885 TaxID=2783828 RepID=UPI00188B69E5|nr:hypothetical protein [Plantibacter sp. VKM Ac-2885]MBF4514087.1 hypothetical protein [Plantibacter sp. VKM Ac-2885]